jgi:hypothetical protein
VCFPLLVLRRLSSVYLCLFFCVLRWSTCASIAIPPPQDQTDPRGSKQVATEHLVLSSKGNESALTEPLRSDYCTVSVTDTVDLITYSMITYGYGYCG